MKLKDTLKELLFPEKCRFCGEKIERAEAPLCKKCLKLYNSQKYRICGRCGQRACRCACRPMIDSPFVFTYLSVFRYDENTPGGRMILSVKDRRDKPSLSLLGRDLSDSLQAGCILRCDALVTYVPRKNEAVLEKGIDQAKELAEIVSDLCTLPLIPALTHIGSTAEQKTLGHAERLTNAKESYALSDHCPDLSGRQIVLVDDIRTTGSTLHTCAALLKNAGAGQIVCLSAGAR